MNRMAAGHFGLADVAAQHAFAADRA